MEIARRILQVFIAFGIANVWLFRLCKPTKWRAGKAKNMWEEFAVYGLPEWLMYLTGIAKIGAATVLLLGIWFPSFTLPAAWTMSGLMLAAVIMHLKAKDFIPKALPAIVLLAASLFIAISLTAS